MKCSWKDCSETATNPQLDKFGNRWANLCDAHHSKLNASLDSLNPRLVLSSWVLASGGAKSPASKF